MTNTDVIANEPEGSWRHGMGFWVNDHGRQQPELPRDSLAASGGGARHIWVSPGHDLVVILDPAPRAEVRRDKDGLKHEQDTLLRIVDMVIH